jgi:hypothetical protein
MRCNKCESSDCEHQQCSLYELQRCDKFHNLFVWSELLRRVDERVARGGVRMEFQRKRRQQQLMRCNKCESSDCEYQQCSLYELQRCDEFSVRVVWSELLRRVDECVARRGLRMEFQRKSRQQQLMRCNKCESSDCGYHQCSLYELQRCDEHVPVLVWSELLRRVDECVARGGVRMESQRKRRQQQLMRCNKCEWSGCEYQQCSLYELQRCDEFPVRVVWSELLRRVDERVARGSVRMEFQFCGLFQRAQCIRFNMSEILRYSRSDFCSELARRFVFHKRHSLQSCLIHCGL